MEELDEVEQRVVLAEKQSNLDVSRQIQLSRNSDISVFTPQINEINEGLKSLSLQIGEIKLSMLYLIKMLRLTSTSGELETVNKKVEMWNPHTYITKTNFVKLLKESK